VAEKELCRMVSKLLIIMSGLNANLPLVGEAEGANAGDSLPGEAIERHVSKLAIDRD
jgi:hypothetical protein